jgi:hypothetical protein
LSKVFLHLGAHKTATSFLQANFMVCPWFEEQGWRFICLQRHFPALRKHALQARKNGIVKSRGEAPFAEFFAEMRAEPRNIFFSSEILLGQMSMRRTGEIYPHHAAMIAKLKEQLTGKDVKVAYCIRDFGDYVESGYNWLIGRGKSRDFGAYSKKITVKTLSWLKILDSLSDTFGAENLIVWTYEDFKKNSVEGLKDIAEAAGLDRAGITIPKQKPRNVSKPPDIIELLSLWNKTLRNRDDLSREQKQEIDMKLREVLAELPPPPHAPRHLPLKKRERFSAHYQEELRQIRAKWGKNMLTFQHTPDAGTKDSHGAGASA